MRQAVVVTGSALLTPAGDLAGTWQALLAEKPSEEHGATVDAGAPQGFGLRVASFPAGRYGGDRRIARLLDRRTQLGVAACEQAMAGADLANAGIAPERLGVCVGSGGTEVAPAELARALRAAPFDPVTFAGVARACYAGTPPLSYISRVGNMVGAHAAILAGAQGPNETLTSDAAASLQAIGWGARQVRSGELDAVLAGGADSRFEPWMIGALAEWPGLLSRSGATRPFDARRDGFLLAEGAGFLLLESEAQARRRGATVLAEVAGYGCANDPSPPQRPSPGGAALARAISAALADACVPPEQVDAVLAAGLGTEAHDLAEARAIRAVLGGAVPVTATKGVLGQLLCAAGVVDVACAIQAMRTGSLPAVAGLERAGPGCDLALVRAPRPGDYRHLLVNAVGLGGVAVSLLLRRAP